MTHRCRECGGTDFFYHGRQEGVGLATCNTCKVLTSFPDKTALPVPYTRRVAAKVGSGASTIVRVMSVRTVRVGQRMRFKEVLTRTPLRNVKVETGIVDDIDFSIPRIFITRM